MHYKKYKSILSAPCGMNIYRGCSHGCIYCDSRSHCYQTQHDFEDIEIKENAPDMLAAALCKTIEPRASTTEERFEALKLFVMRGFPPWSGSPPFYPLSMIQKRICGEFFPTALRQGFAP